jgi:hypothetical protein
MRVSASRVLWREFVHELAGAGGQNCRRVVLILFATVLFLAQLSPSAPTAITSQQDANPIKKKPRFGGNAKSVEIG